jgi:hypothetical protein
MPATRKTPKTSPRTKIQDAILQGLQTPIKRAPVSASYRAALLAVAVAMLLLPVIYLGLIFLIGHTIYWYSLYASSSYRQSASNDVGMQHLLVCLVGGITILFLIKPIFAGWGPKAKPIRLKREAELFLFA